MSMSPLTVEQAEALRAQFELYERTDIRRVTFMTAWSITLLYVFFDLLLRWGAQHGFNWALWVSNAITLRNGPLVIICIMALVLIWAVYFAVDALIEAAGAESWVYRFGSLNYTRPICVGCLAALIVAGMFAIQIQLPSPGFWLLGCIWAVTLIVCLIDDWEGMAERGAIASNRLRVLAHRIPIVGRFVRVRPPQVLPPTGREPDQPPAPDQPPTPDAAAPAANEKDRQP